MKTKLATAVALTGGLVIGLSLAAGYWKPLKPEAPVESSNNQSSDAREAAAMIEVAKQVKDMAPSSASRPAAASAALPAPDQPFRYGKEIADYAQLRGKVFASETDKLKKKTLFADRDLLSSVGEFLLHPAGTDFDAQVQQTAALDLLLDAVRTPEGAEAAGEALRAIVLDPQIESETLDLESRKNLAGVKAEVLFQWTALDAGKANEIRSWLPGPVSQKIWANVADTQSRNMRESALVGVQDVE